MSVPVCAVVTCPGCNNSFDISAVFQTLKAHFQDRLSIRRIFSTDLPGNFDFVILINGCHHCCGTADEADCEIHRLADTDRLIETLESCMMNCERTII